MATGTRLTIAPASFNSGAGGSAFPVYSAPGVDVAGTGGTAFATAWGSSLGVMIPNNGLVWLYYVCGGTAGGVVQVLVGDLAGNTGQVLPATTETYTIAASTSGWLGPWAMATYNQQAPANVTYSGAINTTALTSAAQGCVVVDFTTTTTLCVRAYQTAQAT
jgi:hypothetical protein